MKHASISSGSSCLINYERRTTFELIALIITIKGVTPSPASALSPLRYQPCTTVNVYLKYDRISVSNFEIYRCPQSVGLYCDCPILVAYVHYCVKDEDILGITEFIYKMRCC